MTPAGAAVLLALVIVGLLLTLALVNAAGRPPKLPAGVMWREWREHKQL